MGNRAWQIDRLVDREEEYWGKQLAEGLITLEEYNTEMRNLQREVREAYEADLEDARREVDADWGNW